MIELESITKVYEIGDVLILALNNISCRGITGLLAVSGIKLGGYQVQAPISPDTVFVALTIAIFIGLVSGSYPAFRAASLDPIQSLRHE